MVTDYLFRVLGQLDIDKGRRISRLIICSIRNGSERHKNEGKPCLFDVCEYPDPDRDGAQRVVLATGSQCLGQRDDVDVNVAAEGFGDSGVQLGVELVVVDQVFGVGSQGGVVTAIRMLTAGTGPQVVLIDDADDPQDVLSWLPERLRCRVVVITHRKPPEGLAPSVEVGPLSLDEGLALFAERCPNLAPELAVPLIVEFGYRVKAITQISKLLSELVDTDVRELVGALLEDPVRGLDVSVEITEESLAHLYREMIAHVDREYPDSLRLLDLLAYAGHSNMTERCTRAFVAADIIEMETASSRLDYLRQVRPLLKVGLLHQRGDRQYLDPLAARVARQLRTASAPSVVSRICTTTVMLEPYQEVNAFELAARAWSPVDIAAFETAVHVAMCRLDIRGLEGSVPVVRNKIGIDSFASISASESW